MANMKVPVLLSCSFIVLLIAQTAWGQILYNTSATVTPPAGNSPKYIVKTVSSYLIYTCVKGTWVRGHGYATLLDEKTSKMMGNYTTTVDNEGELAKWTLLNSPGDAAESGASASAVTGRLVASSLVRTGSLPDQLMEAASHVNDGAAALVSYIQEYNIVGGLPPAKEKCSTKVFSVTVSFTAKFCLWTQDTVPASVPVSLVAPGRLTEGFFGQGYVNYKYGSSGWVESGRVATLYSAPGTPALGQYTLTSGIECWKVYDPNGLVLYGLRTSPFVWVEANACPWSLSKVTSASGQMMSFGAFSHVQTTSTRGGIVPAKNYSQKAAQGATWGVPFSAIFWFYVSE